MKTRELQSGKAICSRDESARPIDLATGKPLEPRAQPGYYPDYDVLTQQAFWDEATRKVVLERVRKIPPIRFFTADEAELFRAVCDRIIPQDDRDDDHRIVIVNFIDQRLYENRLDGYRFENMPPDQEAYRLGLGGIEEIAKHLYGRNFLGLIAREQEFVLKTIHDGNPPAGHDVWKRMPVHRFWHVLVQDVVGIYYAHPYAWNEIGFGGPAYPRGYMRLENGDPEPWEVEEQRYKWEAPQGSPSADYGAISGMSEPPSVPEERGAH